MRLLASLPFLALIVVLLAVSPSAAASPWNLLANPSFESGAGNPQGWGSFGTASRLWEFGGHEGERCVSVTGDGLDAGWWHSKALGSLEPNRLYRADYWVRGSLEIAEGSVLVGLNSATWHPSVGRSWQRVVNVIRTPNALTDPAFRVGQAKLKGCIFFDDVCLVPVVGIHRSTEPGGGLSLGEGERIEERRYTAVHVLSDPTTNDRRFLDHYTADFRGDRWVLEDGDEVVYRHDVVRLGVDVFPAEGSMKGVVALPGMPVDQVVNDIRAKRNFAHDRMVVEVQVDRCDGGSLSVAVSRDGRTWNYLGSIAKVGHHELTVPEALTAPFCPYVRLRGEAERVDVSHYRFSSVVGGGRNVNATGGSRYLAVLFSTSQVEVDIRSVADRASHGRNEVDLRVTNQGERVSVDVAVWIEGGDAAGSPSRNRVHLAPGSTRAVCLEYAGELGNDKALFIRGRNGATGELLFLLEGFALP